MKKLSVKQNCKYDDNTIEFLISHFCTCHPTRTFQFTTNDVITHDELLRKIRHLKHQNEWKPSEEQVKALEYFVRSIGESGFASPYDNNTKLVYSLLLELKKLRE